MTVEDFIKAMPKAVLDVRLEGIFRRDTLMIIADQNEVASSTKNFPYWIELLDNPECERLHEITQQVSQWLQEPDDLTRLVYDAGVILSHENVKYAEIVINPSLFMLPGMAFDEFLSVLNDGRERAERGWKVKIRWILAIPRNEPRRADEIVRWATSATGRKGGVVGLGLYGDETSQPIGQFERAFAMAAKKDLPAMAQIGAETGAEGVKNALDTLELNRIADGRGAFDSLDVLKRLESYDVALNVSVARSLSHDWVKERSAYPLRNLVNSVPLIIGTDMPTYYKTSLTDEYIAAMKHNELTLDEIERIAMNAVQYSFLPQDEKTTMLEEFKANYEDLRSQLSVEPESS